jgi:hypothetical protein
VSITTTTGEQATPQQAASVPDPVPFWGICVLGTILFAVALVVFFILIQTWPVAATDPKGGYSPASLLFWKLESISPDGRLFITVAAAGALGSLIHNLTSFVDFVGNRRLAQSWIWWILLRTPIGMALALLFYLVLRGGLIVPTLPDAAGSSGSTTSLLNPYGFAAIAAMAGMFSKQATDKLREIFDTLFRTAQPVNRADPLGPAPPTITAVAPAKLAVKDSTKILTITGAGFKPDCKATINGESRAVERISDSQLKLTLVDQDVAATSVLQLIVQNPDPNGESSKAFPVTVG